jgi:hypothetical protein
MTNDKKWSRWEGFNLDEPPPQLLEQEVENLRQVFAELGYVMVSGSDMPNQTVRKQVESIYSNPSRVERLLRNGHTIGPLILDDQYIDSGIGVWVQKNK